MRRFLFPLIFVLFISLAQTSEAQNKATIVVPDDCLTIEQAYANVMAGGVITIKPGKYKLSETLEVNRNVTFHGDAENPENVVIDCPDHAFMITGESPTFQNLTVSSGEKSAFLVAGCTPKLFHCIITSPKSVGIFITGKETNPTVEKCIVKDCGSSGMFIHEGRGEFRDCDFYGNEGAGIAVSDSGNPTVTGCKIHDNKTHGVYVSQKGLGKFRDCDIYGNESAGISVEESGNPTVTGCKIHDGKSIGVVVIKEGRGEFRDCDIYGNEKGILVGDSGNPTVIGCKIHNNKSVGVGITLSGLGEFRDCNIYGNGAPGIAVSDSGNPTVTECKIPDAIFIGPKGKGTFNNNTLSENSAAGENFWIIDTDAGEVKASGNTPEMPKR